MLFGIYCCFLNVDEICRILKYKNVATRLETTNKHSRTSKPLAKLTVDRQTDLDRSSSGISSSSFPSSGTAISAAKATSPELGARETISWMNVNGSN